MKVTVFDDAAKRADDFLSDRFAERFPGNLSLEGQHIVVDFRVGDRFCAADTPQQFGLQLAIQIGHFEPRRVTVGQDEGPVAGKTVG